LRMHANVIAVRVADEAEIAWMAAVEVERTAANFEIVRPLKHRPKW
jgi:hypothetical protein